MANTGEIQDLTVSWEGYAGTSVEAFIKKEFTSALNGEVGVEISNYRTEGGILPVSNVYTYQNNPITPIVVREDRVLGGSTKLYFPIYSAEYSFEPYTEKLEYFVFEYRSGYEVETGYYYIETTDELPSWVAKQNAEKLPTATTTSNGLMSSTDKGKLDKVVTVQPQTFTNEQKAQAQANIGIVIDDNPTTNSQNLVKSGGVKASVDYVYINSIGVRAQDYFTDEQKTQARTNIGAASISALNNKVDKVTGKGLSTNDFKVIELSDYTSSDDELPTDDNLIYTYRGQVVEKRMCKLDGDNDAFLFIINRDLADYEMDDLTVLAYIRSGGSDYEYTYDGTYYTNNSDCPKWVKSACGIIYANSENAGLMSPSVYDDLLTLNEKADKTTVRDNERVIAEALNDLESRKANASDVYTKTQTDSAISNYTYDKDTIDEKISEGGSFNPEQYYDKTATDNLLNTKANNNEVVKLAGAQNITGEKTFVGNKLIKFKQSAASNKLGFTLYNNNNIETSSFEFRPDTFTESDGKHALLYLGHYRTTSDAASVKQTYVGFRQYDQSNNAAFHILAPLPQNAKTTFGLTTTFKDFYMPLGFKLDSSNTVLTNNTGLVDLSNYLYSKSATDALLDSLSDEITDCEKKRTIQNIHNTSSSITSTDVSVGNDYICTNAVDTLQFNLSGNNGYIGLFFTTGTNPNITFNATTNVYAQDGLTFEANSRYEVRIKVVSDYYITAIKMVQLN